MKLSPAGVEALKQYEGLSLTAYRDSGGVWTIGYGSTRDVREGMRISQAEADQRFLADTEWAQAAVRTDVVVPITQPQFDALVSLAYNIGAGAFAKSTLVRLLSARYRLGPGPASAGRRGRSCCRPRRQIGRRHQLHQIG